MATKAKTKRQKIKQKRARDGADLPALAATPKRQPDGRKRQPTPGRPPKERRAKGRMAKGADGVWREMECDVIAKLYQAGAISSEQKDALIATWADLRRWRHEIGAKSGRDCLTLSEPRGFDPGDGDPVLHARMLTLAQKMGQLWPVVVDICDGGLSRGPAQCRSAARVLVSARRGPTGS